jgi:hypothetical protein
MLTAAFQPLTPLRLSYSAPLLRTTLFICAACPAPPVRRTRANLRASLIPFVPNWLAIGGWLYGVYRFNAGFEKTSYQKGFKVPLALAWPVFIAFNASYRKNFVKAIKKSDEF